VACEDAVATVNQEFVSIFALVAALQAFGASGPSSIKTSTVETAMSAPLPAKDAIDVPRPTPQASPARPADASIATVFECRVSGQRIYSDQRCGSKATSVRFKLQIVWMHRTRAFYRALMRYSHDRDPSEPILRSR
jgi:hypothetical protein